MEKLHLFKTVYVMTVLCIGSHSIMSNSCDPMECSPPASSVHRILQAKILEWVAIHFSRESSQPRDWTLVSCIARQILYHLSHQGSPVCSFCCKYHSIVWLCHILFIHLPANRLSDCFQILTVVNKAAMDMQVQVFLVSRNS